MHAQLRVPAASLVIAALAACGNVTEVVRTGNSSEAPAPPSTRPSPDSTAPERRPASSSFDPEVVWPAWERWQGEGWLSLQQPAVGGVVPVQIVFSTYREITDDPLGCHVPREAAMPSTVDELVASISANPAIVAELRGRVRVGRFSGPALDVALTSTWTETCTESAGRPAAVVPSVVYLEAGWRQRLVLVDVGETILVIRITAGDPDDLESAVAQALPVLQRLDPLPWPPTAE